MNGWKRYIQKRVNRDKTDFATKARMLGLPASAGAPALAETGGLAVAQLLPPWLERSSGWLAINWHGKQKAHFTRQCGTNQNFQLFQNNYFRKISSAKLSILIWYIRKLFMILSHYWYLYWYQTHQGNYQKNYWHAKSDLLLTNIWSSKITDGRSVRSSTIQALWGKLFRMSTWWRLNRWWWWWL